MIAAVLPSLALLAAVLPGHSDVAYVYSYEGFAANYAVQRAGKTEPVAPFLPLQTGDRVSVLAATGANGRKLALVLSIGGLRYTVNASNSPFCIGPKGTGCAANAALSSGAANPALTVLKNILASVAPIFGEAQEDAYSSQQEAMTGHRQGTAEPPKIPMLPAAPIARAALKSSALAFAWLDGKAPFKIQLSGGTGCAARQSGVSANSATFRNLRIAPGTACRLRIEDADRQAVSAGFEVVAPQALPGLSIDQIVNDPDLPADVLKAALLARQGRQWYLAAYQAVADAADDPQHQALQLRSWLAEGQPPPP